MDILQVRQIYKEFGLLELHCYETQIHTLGMDYSKIPTYFADRWFTPDRKFCIDLQINDDIRIYLDYSKRDQRIQKYRDGFVWVGNVEDSLIELKRLGYGK